MRTTLVMLLCLVLAAAALTWAFRNRTPDSAPPFPRPAPADQPSQSQPLLISEYLSVVEHTRGSGSETELIGPTFRVSGTVEAVNGNRLDAYGNISPNVVMCGENPFDGERVRVVFNVSDRTSLMGIVAGQEVALEAKFVATRSGPRQEIGRIVFRGEIPPGSPPPEKFVSLQELQRIEMETIEAKAKLNRLNVFCDGPEDNIWIKLTARNLTESGAVHPDVLVQLKRLSHIRRLEVEGPLSTDGADELAGFTTVRELSLQTPSLDDESARKLSELVRIGELAIHGPTRLSGVGLAFFGRLKGLRTFELRGTRDELSWFTDDALAALAGCIHMEVLGVNETPITDKGLAPLRSMKRLRELNLNGTSLDGSGLAYLPQSGTLRELYLFRTGVTDAGLLRARGINSLRLLHLGKTKVAGPGLNVLADTRVLHWLSLQHTKIGDAALIQIAACPSIRTLQLSGTQITDVGLARYCRTPFLSLETLWLDQTAITDAGLSNLSSLRHLTQLSLSPEMRISTITLEQLKRQLPKLEVSQ